MHHHSRTFKTVDSTENSNQLTKTTITLLP